MEASKILLHADDELREARAIADIVMSAFCEENQAPDNISVVILMGHCYEHLKALKEDIDKAREALKREAAPAL